MIWRAVTVSVISSRYLIVILVRDARMRSQCSENSSFSDPRSLFLSKFHMPPCLRTLMDIYDGFTFPERQPFCGLRECPSMDQQGRPRDQSKIRVTSGAEILVWSFSGFTWAKMNNGL